jgi:hypothetical protein
MIIEYKSSKNPEAVEMLADTEKYSFQKVPLIFDEGLKTNVFKDYAQKTLIQFTEKYLAFGFYDKIEKDYANFKNMPLGHFLLQCKNNGDTFYKNYLLEYGDSTYSTFHIADKDILNKMGVYLYWLEGEKEPSYIGITVDSFKK